MTKSIDFFYICEFLFLVFYFYGLNKYNNYYFYKIQKCLVGKTFTFGCM